MEAKDAAEAIVENSKLDVDGIQEQIEMVSEKLIDAMRFHSRYVGAHEWTSAQRVTRTLAHLSTQLMELTAAARLEHGRGGVALQLLIDMDGV